MSNSEPVLSVRNLRVEFPTRRGTLTAVDDISFDIAAGEVLGVVGESGAGKSMTGTAVIGLLEPPGRIAGGEVLLKGRRIDNLPNDEIRRIRGKRIGRVFQDPHNSLNPPSLIGKGVTGLAAGSRATAEQVALGRAVFETVGTVVEVPESQIDALSTISGSGPAYVFYLVEQLTRTAVNLGFTPAQAAELVTGTFLGSVELLVASGREPEELRRQVTSPNGTTQRAIAELEKADLTGLFDRATASALARAKEMAEGR